ncbi:MAG TPA: hypothetical protein VNU66_03340 [Mycobacteriales bacterium]|nr:hypothetical protein [Mycobacteriales bacterium]
MRRSLLLVPVLVLTAACSGGGDGGEPSLEERREAYLTAAEDVCTETNIAVRELGTPAGVAEVPAFADRAVEVVRSSVEELTAVEPPAEDAAEVTEKVYDPLRADVTAAEAYAEQLKAAAAANDTATLLRLVGERPQTTADLAFMRDYGFDQCVRAADQTD